MLCMSVFSILQQHCCGVLFFINNSVVQHAELNVTAPDAVLHGTVLPVLPQESAVILQNPLLFNCSSACIRAASAAMHETC